MQPSLLVKDPDFEYDIQNECTIDANLLRCAAITRDGKMSPSSQKRAPLNGAPYHLALTSCHGKRPTSRRPLTSSTRQWDGKRKREYAFGDGPCGHNKRFFSAHNLRSLQMLLLVAGREGSPPYCVVRLPTQNHALSATRFQPTAVVELHAFPPRKTLKGPL